jgi:tight adherence protein B
MILLLTFGITLLATCALVLFTGRQKAARKIVQLRLTAINAKAAESDGDAIELAAKSKQRFSDRIGERVNNYHFGESLGALIVHAGSKLTVGRVLLISAILGPAAALLAHSLTGLWLVALASGGAGSFALYGFLLFQKSRRLDKFNTALPDAIDLMSRALRAGHSMASSIEVIAEQSPEPLAGEFARCFQQQKFGIPFRDVLLAMGERVPSDDLQFLITAVLIQKETGGDLTDILDRTTAVIRERVRIAGEVRTKTAQGRMTGWILSLLPVILLVIINVINPGYSHILFYDPLGQKLLAAAGIMILIGAFIIGRIVDIKV